MKRPLVLLQIFSLAFTTAGCGTLISGTHQQVQLEISPAGTEVTVYRWDGKLVAGPEVSPGVMNVQRPYSSRWVNIPLREPQPYLVRESKDGYCPHYWLTSVTTSAGGAVDMLLVVPGVIVLAPALVGFVSAVIDSKTGGMNSMQPDHLVGSLRAEKACAE